MWFPAVKNGQVIEELGAFWQMHMPVSPAAVKMGNWFMAPERSLRPRPLLQGDHGSESDLGSLAPRAAKPIC